MNNQWRDNPGHMVVWADETYDHSRKCDACANPTCTQPVHTDYYREVGTTDLEESLRNGDESVAASSYWSWMHLNTPKGSKTDFDGESIAFETDFANPDNLEEIVSRNSGITEEQHKWMQDAFQLLSDRQKSVWTAILREQKSQVSVAADLGISEAAVTQLLNRARASVTEYLRTKAEQHDA